jgi:uncharacterized protein
MRTVLALQQINLSRIFATVVAARAIALAAAMLLMLPTPTYAASFDCAKAATKVEHLVCDNPKLSELDSKLGQDYQDVLGKANDEQKQSVMAEQKHWLQHTRDVCETETCLKHAYWSRQAALEAWFEPRSPLHQKESDKAEDIKKVLATAPLYPTYDTPFCQQVFEDLKQMKGIRFVDPVAQTQSYEDPALDPWKKNCQSAPPFHFTYGCAGGVNIPENADAVLRLCEASYGLPPFKIYELPPSGSSKEKRYIFYNDEGYGPMNWEHKPDVGRGFSGFRQIHVTQCMSTLGNPWRRGENKWSDWAKNSVFAQAYPHDRNSMSYNSIIEYKNSYYFLIVTKGNGSNWLSVEAADDRTLACNWTPVKPK